VEATDGSTGWLGPQTPFPVYQCARAIVESTDASHTMDPPHRVGLQDGQDPRPRAISVPTPRAMERDGNGMERHDGDDTYRKDGSGMLTDTVRAAKPATTAVQLGRIALVVAATFALLPGVAFACPCADARCLPLCSENAAPSLYPSDPPVIRG
jgi:hypothetical protein